MVVTGSQFANVFSYKMAGMVLLIFLLLSAWHTTGNKSILVKCVDRV